MRSVNPTTLQALEAGERVYDARVRLGGRDVPADSWSVDRGYDTGLPDSVAAPVGSTAAQMTADLTGEGTQTAAQRYSPWAPRSTADIARPGQSATLSWGVAGQDLQTFRGRVRKVQATARDGSADVTALDGAELLRGRAAVPPCVGHTATGIRMPWLVDHALRMSGIYASPPPRQDAMYQVLFASMFGSLEANLGMRVRSSQLPDWRPQRSPWTAGPAHDQGEGWSVTWAPQRRVLSQVTTLVVEWWVYRRDTSDDDPSEVTLRFRNSEDASGADEIAVGYDPGARQLTASINGDSASWNLSATTDQAGRFKVVFVVDLPALGLDVVVRGWLYQPNGNLFGSSEHTGGDGFEFGFLHEVTAQSRSPMECINVSRPSSGWSVVGEWRRGADIDVFSESGAVAANAHYALAALPAASGSWWDLLKDLAADTLSYMGFDEDGIFHFRRYEYVRPEGDHTPDLILSSRREIGGATAAEEADAIANRVSVGVTRFDRTELYTEEYHYNGVTSVNSGEFVAVEFDFGSNRPWFIRCPMMYTGSIPTEANVVRMVTSSGSIAPVEVELDFSGEFPVLYYHNRGANTAYSATSSSLATGSLRWAHADVPSESLRPVVRQHTASQARYGVQSLELGNSEWRQNAFFSDQLARQLLEWTAWPVPMTGDIDILPDPRLQLGDIVEVVEPTGVRIDGLFRVMGYKVSGSGAEVSMTVSVRPLYRPDQPADVGLTTEPILDPDAAPELPG